MMACTMLQVASFLSHAKYFIHIFVVCRSCFLLSFRLIFFFPFSRFFFFFVFVTTNQLCFCVHTEQKNPQTNTHNDRQFSKNGIMLSKVSHRARLYLLYKIYLSLRSAHCISHTKRDDEREAPF